MHEERAAIAYVQTYFDLWMRHFPGMARRSFWTVAAHLCLEARRRGAAFTTLHGLCRSLYGSDEATLKQHLHAMVVEGWCESDPPGEAIRARTMFVASPQLLTRFEAQTRDAGRQFESVVAVLGGRPSGGFGDILTDTERALPIEAARRFGVHAEPAIDDFFVERTLRLGSARLEQVQQRLRTVSHGTLLRLLLARHLDHEIGGAPGETAIAADELAFRLYERTGQGTDTTRDHITDFIRIGVFERGRAPAGNRMLFVALSPQVVPHLCRAAASTARDLLRLGNRPGEVVALPKPRLIAEG